MSSGGTGKLPPFRAGATGKLTDAGAAKSAKGGGPDNSQSTAPAELVNGAAKNIGDWFDSPGEHKRPPEWLVDQVAGDLVAYSQSQGVELDGRAVKAQVRDRLKDLARDQGDRDPSRAEIKEFARTQVEEFAQVFNGAEHGRAMMPIV